MRAALLPEAYGATRRPATPCVLIDGEALPGSSAETRLLASVREALDGRAPAVVVLCARGEALLSARMRLRALDRLLAPVANELGARVSRSATDGLAAWGASRAAPIGVDVQCAPAALEESLLEAALHVDELGWFRTRPDPTLAFARLWAGKEAVLKAFGVGLAWSPCEVPVLPVASSWHAVEVHALGHAWFTHIEAIEAPRVALAVALNAGHAAPP